MLMIILNIKSVVVIKKCTINNKPFTFVLISRRSIYRAGTTGLTVCIFCTCCVANFISVH